MSIEFDTAGRQVQRGEIYVAGPVVYWPSVDELQAEITRLKHELKAAQSEIHRLRNQSKR